MTRLWVLLVLVTVVAACGDSGGDGESAPASVTSTSVTTASEVDVASSTTTDTVAECSSDSLDGGSVSTVGFDDITFGMTVAEAETATGVCLRPDRPVNQGCYRVVPDPGPEGMSFLVTEGTIERVDVFGGSATTRSGIGVGSTEDEVTELFGASLEVRPHADGAGRELVFVPQDEADAAFRVVFETNGEVVTRYRSGRVPQVDVPVACPGGDEVASTTTTG